MGEREEGGGERITATIALGLRTMDIPYHYPPELLDLLVDTIPLLTRAKPGVLDFLRGAGVQEGYLADLREQVARAPETISKYVIARRVLTRINNEGDATLRERREIVKRVVEFDDYSSCWPADRLKAEGLVARIAKLVNAKDTFSRMKQERAEERQKRMAEVEAKAEEKRKKEAAIERASQEFYRLFGERNSAKRGRLVEKAIAHLFEAVGISIREPFTIVEPESGGIVEQVDGMIELDSRLFLVEIKWLQGNLDKGDASAHLVRVYHRPEVHGLFISATVFTQGALAVCTEALQKERLVVLCTLQEFFQVLEARADLLAFLRAKVHAVIAQKIPFPQVSI